MKPLKFIKGLFNKQNKPVAPPVSEYPELDYLEVAYRCCELYQEEKRKTDPFFNVWFYLEKEFEKKYQDKFIKRNPPKMITINQWFRTKNRLRTGAKMGTEDLKFICKLINNTAPITVYLLNCLNEANVPMNEQLDKIKTHLQVKRAS